LLVGEIGKPHGLAGEVYVNVVSDDPRRFARGSRLLHESGRRLRVEQLRKHRDRALIKFEGIDDRDAAALLKGPLYVLSAEMRSLGEGEYWAHDLAGLSALDPAGQPLGTVTRVIPGAAQDLLEIQTPVGLRLAPLVADIVTEVDVEAGRVTLNPPAGLLD
jgi:16S rRNA processing protein RimM